MEDLVVANLLLGSTGKGGSLLIGGDGALGSFTCGI
jgi:hypothetical protein